MALERTSAQSTTSHRLHAAVGDPNYGTVGRGPRRMPTSRSPTTGAPTRPVSRGSFFDFWGRDSYGTRLNIEDGTTDTSLFAWTFSGGNGFSFTVRRKTGVERPSYTSRATTTTKVRNYLTAWRTSASTRVGALRRSWCGSPYPRLRTSADDDSDIGFAVGAGLRLGIPGGWTFDWAGRLLGRLIGYISADPGGFGDFDSAPPARTRKNESWSVRAGISGPLLSRSQCLAERHLHSCRGRHGAHDSGTSTTTGPSAVPTGRRPPA